MNVFKTPLLGVLEPNIMYPMYVSQRRKKTTGICKSFPAFEVIEGFSKKTVER
jgi:hypothetical protein